MGDSGEVGGRLSGLAPLAEINEARGAGLSGTGEVAGQGVDTQVSSAVVSGSMDLNRALREPWNSASDRLEASGNRVDYLET